MIFIQDRKNLCTVLISYIQIFQYYLRRIKDFNSDRLLQKLCETFPPIKRETPRRDASQALDSVLNRTPMTYNLFG